MRGWPSIGALALVGLACEPAPSEGGCPAWTDPAGARCVLRGWQLDPSPLGREGAREVQAALGPDGHALLAWTHATSTEGSVVLAEPAAAGWTVTEVSSPSRGLEPAIALGPEGRALLSWKLELDDGEVWLASRDDHGAWSWPERAQSWAGAAYEPRVGFGPDGEALLVWNQWTGDNFGVAVARRPAEDPDGAFRGPQAVEDLLSPAVNYSNAPRLAIGPDGDAVIAWYQAPVDDLMVFASERAPGDPAFSRPDAAGHLSPAGGPVDSHPEANPQPAVHASGRAAVAWTQQLDDDRAAVFVATRDPDGAWRRPASLDDSISDRSAYARCPRPAFAPDGTLVITWYETVGARSSVLAWRHPVDEDPSGPEVLSEPDAEAVHPALGIAPDDGTVVVWSQREGMAWQVVARRHQPGPPRWLPTEPLADAQLGLAPTPALAVSDDGQVLVAWAEGSVVEGRVRVAALPAASAPP